MDRPPLVIYHANCMDGFAAACVVAKYLGGNGVYLACQYGDPLPDVDGREVFVVDFSWKLPEMLELVQRADKVHWIDHHATSADYAADVQAAQRAKPGAMIHAHDQSMCGALLAWDALFDAPPPPVLRYVDDRDRWQWSLEWSREVSAALALRWSPHWNEPVGSGWSGVPMFKAFLITDPEDLVSVGRQLRWAQEARIGTKLKRAKLIHGDELGGPWAGLRVGVINTDGDISETGSTLCETSPIDVAVMYFADGDEWVHSLRSRHGADVSAIAKHYGGGGHKAAAGFRHTAPIATWHHYKAGSV